MNRNISDYKHSGNISFWEIQNNRNYPQWNLACNEIGKNSLIKLLDLMLLDNFSSRATIDNNSPIDLGQLWVQALPAIRSFAHLTIHHKKDEHSKSNIQIADDVITLTLNTDKLIIFSRHIKADSFDLTMTIEDSVLIGFW